MLVDIDIENLRNFAKYPFNLSMDEKMKQLLESIVINGIITPLIVRKKDEYYGIISGHRRKYIAEILNIRKLVDSKRIAFRPAVELSYLSKESQVIIRNIFDMNEVNRYI